MTSQPVIRSPRPLSPTPFRHPLLYRRLVTPSQAAQLKRRCVVYGEDLDQKIRQTIDINQVFSAN